LVHIINDRPSLSATIKARMIALIPVKETERANG